MSSFPPLNWEVRYIEDMDKIFLDEGSSSLSVAALLAVKPARGAEGDFRFILMGSDPICARVKASSILPASVLDRYLQSNTNLIS